MRHRLVFVIPGPPQPCERARVFIPKGARFPIATTPPKTRAYEEHVGHVTRVAVARNREWQRVVDSKCHLRVSLHFVRQHDRGDWDNHAKSITDGMNGIAWADDRLVRYALISVETWPREHPRVEVLVEPVYAPLDEPLWARVARENGWRPAPANLPADGSSGEASSGTT